MLRWSDTLVKRSLYLVLLALLPAACIDDPLADRDEGIPITEGEAEILGIQVWRTAFLAREEIETPVLDVRENPAATGSTGGVPGTPPVGMAPIELSGSSTEILPCPVSGDVVTDILFDLVVDDVTGLGEIDLSVTQAHRGCASEEEGVAVVLNADPGITLTMRLVQDQPDVVGITGTLRGGVDVLVDGKVDVCGITLSFAGVEIQGQESAFALAGEVCGMEMDIQEVQPASS